MQLFDLYDLWVWRFSQGAAGCTTRAFLTSSPGTRPTHRMGILESDA